MFYALLHEFDNDSACLTQALLLQRLCQVDICNVTTSGEQKS